MAEDCGSSSKGDHGLSPQLCLVRSARVKASRVHRGKHFLCRHVAARQLVARPGEQFIDHCNGIRRRDHNQCDLATVHDVAKIPNDTTAQAPTDFADECTAQSARNRTGDDRGREEHSDDGADHRALPPAVMPVPVQAHDITGCVAFH
jgi:hypothetical protein